MANTVSLPGGGKVVYKLPVGTDAKAALTTAIASEFAAAGKNKTMNVVKSGAAGKTGFFNAVVNSSATKVTAGTGVQAIFDLGTGKDTLIGGTSTTLIYGNANDKKGDNISVAGKTTVFGTAGNDTLSVTNGNATAYLEGGTNTVTLSGKADTISIAGTGNAFVNVNAGTKATVIGGESNTTVTLNTGAASVVAGSGAMSVVGGKGAINFTHGAGAVDTVSITKNTGTDTLSGALADKKGGDVFDIASKAGGKFVINNFNGTTDKIVITGATPAQIAAAIKADKHTTTKGVTTTTLTIGSDKITVVGGAVTAKNFT